MKLEEIARYNKRERPKGETKSKRGRDRGTRVKNTPKERAHKDDVNIYSHL